MSRKIKILLEFSGYQHARIDADGDVTRPATARQIAQAIANDIEARFVESLRTHHLKVVVKPLN